MMPVACRPPRLLACTACCAPAGRMQAHKHTVLLVWGLFDDICCSAKPLTVHSHNNSPVMTHDGWNTPGSLLLLSPTSPVQQISLGWTHALLLTEDGEAYVALASQVLQNARANNCSSTLQLPSATNASSGNSSSSSVWQAVQLLSSTTCHGLPAPVLIKQVSAGDQHCLLLDHCGCVWAMGSNQHGQLGLSSKQAAAAVASKVAPASGAGNGAAGYQQELQISCFVAVLGPSSAGSVQQPVQQVAAGSCHSIAVTASLGRLYAWGWNAHGQCGTGSTADVQQPALCTALDGVPLRCVAAGMAHTVAASRDGAVYAWGWGSDGQLGLIEASAVDGDEGAVTASCCSSAAQSGGVGGESGRATQQQQQQRSSLLPVLVEDAELDEEDVVQVACGSRHTVVLTASGRVFAWGLNKHGQCCTAAAREAASGTAAAAASTTATTVSQTISFEVQTITTPTSADLPDMLLLPCNAQAGSVAMVGIGDEAPEATQAGSDGARKLVECEKAVAVHAGRWHTLIEVLTI